MARIRTIKPELFTDPDLAGCSLGARWLFVGLFTEADDNGRLLDSPKRIAGAVFPHDEAVTAAKVKRWLDELEGIGCIARYTSEHHQLIWIPHFLEHQRIAHPTPSKLAKHPHDPQSDSGDPPDKPPSGSRESRETLPNVSRAEVEVGSGSRNGKKEVESSSSSVSEEPPATTAVEEEDWASIEARRRLTIRRSPAPLVAPELWLERTAERLRAANPAGPAVPKPLELVPCQNPDCVGGHVLDDDLAARPCPDCHPKEAAG